MLEKFLNQSTSAGERQELFDMVLHPLYEEEIKKILELVWHEGDFSEKMPEEQILFVKNKILTTIFSSTSKQTEEKPTRSFWPWVWKMRVAAALLIGGLGVYFLFFYKAKGSQSAMAVATDTIFQDIQAPLLSKASLVLQNGNIVSLDSMPNGSLAQIGNVHIIKENESIRYAGTALNKGKNILYNPKGSKVVCLILQDGSKVWLNSGSSLKYPVSFDHADREVELNGEAYFEVTHSTHRRFLVKSGDVATEVLGTQFNINTFKDKETIDVTLISGSVKIRNTTTSIVMAAGTQANLISAGAIAYKKNADLQAALAWKNGFFYFEGATLQQIMKEIERWYGVTVVYSGSSNSKHFSGIVSRSGNVSQVLKIMQLAGIKFKIEEKKITVL